MRISILHQAVDERDTIEDQDILFQVEAVADALRRLGHETATVPCTLNLEAMLDQLRAAQPDLVFNLVESLHGADSLVYLPHAVLDAVDIPYAGNRAESLFLTTHKLLAKERLQNAGLPTPRWIAERKEFVVGRWSLVDDTARSIVNHQCQTTNHQPPTTNQEKWILKGVWEQASRDLDDEAVVAGTRELVMRRLGERSARTGRPSFAEEFIEGREFNVGLLAERRFAESFVVPPLGGNVGRQPAEAGTTSGDCSHPMLADAGGVQVLPPAEIDFSAFPPGKPRIVGHRAKWSEDSFEYNNTPRRFDFPAADHPLLDEIARLAKQCWELFSLHGWARVDFRVDVDNRPWILEINANPCLSPDAGFAAALAQAGVSFDEAVRRIVDDCPAR